MLSEYQYCNQVCGTNDYSGHMQDFGSLSPGLSVVSVQEPQRSVLGKWILYDRALPSCRALFPVLLRPLEDIVSSCFFFGNWIYLRNF